MRRASILSLLLVLFLAVGPTAAFADEPVAVDDPPVAFDDPAPAPVVPAPAPATVKPGVAVVAAEPPSVASIPAATAGHAAPRTVSPHSAPVKGAGAVAPRSGQLPFTGVDSGLIVVVSLMGNLLLIGGLLLYLGAPARRNDIRTPA